MAVKEGLLSLLQPGPRYGYQLKIEFEAVTGGVWTLNVGQVYTTLDRLERDGFVDVDLGEVDGQKSYSLTAAGREELGAWWQSVPAADPPPRDELMLKVLMAIETSKEHALAVITRQRTALFGMLQRHRRNPAETVSDVDSLPARLVIDALVVRAEADLRWLDLCESRLNAGVAPTPIDRTNLAPNADRRTVNPTDSNPMSSTAVSTASLQEQS